MNSKLKKILPIILINFFCVATNLYWFFHQAVNPQFFIELNILTAFTIILVVLLPAFKQQFKK